MFAGISLIINMKAVGMSKTMWYNLHNTPQNSDRINYNSITEICEIKFHNFFVLFYFPGLKIAVSKFQGFSRFSMYEPW